MSDSARKSVTDQVSEKVTPQSQKSTTDKVSESATGLGDKVAGAVQPEGEKSTTQKLSDSTRSNADGAQKEGGSVLDSVTQAGSDAYNSAADTLGGLTGQAKSETKDTTS